MKRKILTTIMFVVLLAGEVWLARTAFSAKEETGPQKAQKPPQEVRVVSATKSAISRTLDLTGEFVAIEDVVIAAMVDGPIVYCPWREGDRVKAGQKLVEIDRRVYRANVQSAEAAVKVARAKLDDMESGTRPEEIAKAEESVRQLEEKTAFAKVDYERTAKLVESGALPGEVLDKVRVEFVSQTAQLVAAKEQLKMLEAGPTRTALAVQQAALDEAEARLALEKAKLAECVIEAPFSGTVMKVHVRPGDMAAAKARLIEVADLSSGVMRFAVPEAFTAQVHTGMALEARLDAYPDKVFNGRVIRVYPDIDRRIRTRTVEAKIAGILDVMPGMFARLILKLRQVDDAVVVPLAALVTTPEGDKVVFVVKDGKALRRKVKTGIEASDRIQVLEGINSGDKVIVSGHKELKDGVDVRVSESAKQEGKSNPVGSSSKGQDGKKREAGGEK
jgi:membrane fusion protein (multidrug efflux system)